MRARVKHTHTHNNTKFVVRRLTPATDVASVGTPCREMRRFAERCSLWSHVNLIGYIGAEQGDLLLSIYRFALECIMALNATCGAGFESKDYIKVTGQSYVLHNTIR